MALACTSSAFAGMLGRSLSGSLKSLLAPSALSRKMAGFSISTVRSIIVSATALQYSSVMETEMVSNPDKLLKCVDAVPGKRLDIRYLHDPPKDFCSFIESTPKEEVVSFFRSVVRELEEKRRLMDYHLKVRDGEGKFMVTVHYGEEKPEPELEDPFSCISCFSSAQLYPDQYPPMEAGECILEEFPDPYVVCRLDKKARSGFVITPIRHVERMSNLDDEEILALWSMAVRVLRHSGLPFLSMILNHGNYRNVRHLHLKVWVDNELYKMYQMKWSKERKEVWERLEELARNRPRKKEKCKFFARSSCRHGDLCSYSHTL